MVMAGIGGLVAENLARHHHAQGRLEVLERSDLYRRSVRAHHKVTVALTEERVVAVPSGMVGVNVQRFEIVVVGFDFGSVEDSVSHGLKEIFELSGDLGKGMKRAAAGSRRRQARIESLAPTLGGHLGIGQGVLPAANGFLHRLLEYIGPLAHVSPLFGRVVGDRGQQSGDNALLADVLAFDCFQAVQILTSEDFGLHIGQGVLFGASVFLSAGFAGCGIGHVDLLAMVVRGGRRCVRFGQARTAINVWPGRGAYRIKA